MVWHRRLWIWGKSRWPADRTSSLRPHRWRSHRAVASAISPDLLGFDAEPAPAVAAGGSATIAAPPASALALTLHWQAEGASDVPYAVSVQLLDESGALRAQHDGQPGGGAFPTTGWVQGEVLADTYPLELPADLAPGAIG